MKTIDWDRVRAIMEKSVRGGKLSDEEGDIITTAWCRAPDEYRKLHDEVREAAHEEMRRSW
jgi:hypothetical protein